MHSTTAKLLDPNHRITIGIYGIGGTGSHVLTKLVHLDKSLVALGHPGIKVIAYDFDDVSAANIGRQKFYPHDEGEPKAEALIKRINAIYGLDWESYKEDRFRENIIITCFDNVTARKIARKHIEKNALHNAYSYKSIHYWLDVGNDKNSGQLIIGSYNTGNKKELPSVADYSNNFENMEDNPNEPSCSLAEALNHQDLMINDYAATITVDFVWKLFRHGEIAFNGVFFNISKMQMRTITIKE